MHSPATQIEQQSKDIAPLSNPIMMNQPPYYRIPVSHVQDKDNYSYIQVKEQLATTIKLIAQKYGGPTNYCVLAGNVIGVGNWQKLNVQQQHEYVTQKAGAFVAAGMMYLHLQGDDAEDLLNYLTPRDISKMEINSALFVLFTSHQGGIDEEAVILRLSENSFLISCGGGKAPSYLHEALGKFPNVTARDVDIVSFNIKGPKRRKAMIKLIAPKDKQRVLALDKFSFCKVNTVKGDSVYVARTIIGMEMWGSSEAIHSAWETMLEQPDIVIPCGWDLLETYRMECSEICFALHPLDMNYGTSLKHLGMSWMFDANKKSDYIGKQILQTEVSENYKLVKIFTDSELDKLPEIGERLFDEEGAECGYITSSGYSYKYNCCIAFAHISASTPNDVPFFTLGGGKWLNENNDRVATLKHAANSTLHSVNINYLPAQSIH